MKRLFVFVLAMSLMAAVSAQIRETRVVAPFTGIEALGVYDVTVVKGNREALVLEAEPDDMPKLQSSVTDGKLKLSIKEGLFGRLKGRVKAIVTVRELTWVSISGACTLASDETFSPQRFKLEQSGATKVSLKLETSDFESEVSGASTVTLSVVKAAKASFECSGASKMKLHVEAHDVEFECSGSSSIEITGKAERCEFDCSGASNVNAENFITQMTKIDAGGASKIRVHAIERLSIDASGASSIRYKGRPMIESDTSGSSSIRAIE